MRWLRSSLLVLHVLTFLGVTHAGFDAVERFRDVKREAAAGDADAHYRLGWQYEHGLGTDRREDLARKHYRIAAEKGVAGAAYSLGLSLRRVPEAPVADAVAWLRKAAELNHTGAMNELAGALAAGRGVPRDVASAVEWYRRAAEAGDALGAYNLGYAHHTGMPEAGVAQDDEEALRWYRQAAEEGLPAGLFAVGASLADGLGTAKDDAQAVQYFQMAASRGSAEAMTTLGLWYSVGRGVGAPDVAAGTRWYVRGAQAGSAKAQFVAGYRLLKGEGAERDAVQGLSWLQTAADRGHAAARRFLEAYRDAGAPAGGAAAPAGSAARAPFGGEPVGHDEL